MDSQSGLAPYLLILAWLSDVYASLRASTQSAQPPDNTFMEKMASYILSMKPFKLLIDCLWVYRNLFFVSALSLESDNSVYSSE